MMNTPEYSPDVATILDGEQLQQAEARTQNKLTALRERLLQKKREGNNTYKKVFISGHDLPLFSDNELYELYDMYTREFKDMILLQFDSEATRDELEDIFHDFQSDPEDQQDEIDDVSPLDLELDEEDEAPWVEQDHPVDAQPVIQAALAPLQVQQQQLLALMQNQFMGHYGPAIAEMGLTRLELMVQMEQVRTSVTAMTAPGNPATDTTSPAPVHMEMPADISKEQELTPYEFALLEEQEAAQRAEQAARATENSAAIAAARSPQYQHVMANYDQNGVALSEEPKTWLGRAAKTIGSRLPWGKKPNPAFG